MRSQETCHRCGAVLAAHEREQFGTDSLPRHWGILINNVWQVLFLVVHILQLILGSLSLPVAHRQSKGSREYMLMSLLGGEPGAICKSIPRRKQDHGELLAARPDFSGSASQDPSSGLLNEDFPSWFFVPLTIFRLYRGRQISSSDTLCCTSINREQSSSQIKFNAGNRFTYEWFETSCV